MIFFFTFMLVTLFAWAETTIRVVGDSHSVNSFCNPGEEQGTWSLEYDGKLVSVPFSIYNMYGVTMHRIGRDGLSLLEKWRRDLIGVKNGDTLIFVFGEIDVRCHILKQSKKQNISIDEIASKLVNSYLRTILDYKDLYEQLTVVVCNVVPPIDRIHLPPYEQHGTLEERVIIAKKINQTLKNKCDGCGIKFLDVYNLFSQMDGSMNPDLSDGSVHISPYHNTIIKEELCRLIGM